MKTHISNFACLLRKRWWGFMLRHWGIAPAIETMQKHRQDVLLEYCSTSERKRRVTAKQAMKVARAELFHYFNFAQGLTEANFSIDILPTIPSLYTRAHINLFAGNSQEALDDLTKSISRGGPDVWLSKAQRMRAWLLVTYYHETELMDQYTIQQNAVDIIGQAAVCGLLLRNEKWTELQAAIASIENQDNRYVIACWLNSLDSTCGIDAINRIISNGSKAAPSFRRMIRLVKLFMIAEALNECDNLIQVTQSRRCRERVQSWRRFLLHCPETAIVPRKH